ncbi:uncharacterized protein [Amphiura filiformis]|uniref:uncharacterized protein n=1 Tax=Amphiura filiformis TaxID=82378 RepID=UPI003B216FE5
MNGGGNNPVPAVPVPTPPPRRTLQETIKDIETSITALESRGFLNVSQQYDLAKLKELHKKAVAEKERIAQAGVSSNVDCSQAIFSHISKLRTDSANTDVTLKIGSKSFQVHKLILSAASPVFNRMFHGNWKENEAKAVELQEDHPECEAVFDTFLDFIYGKNNGVVSINDKNVLPLITLADKYGVDGLTKNCTLFLVTMIEDSIDQAFKWLPIAEEKELTSVLQRCFDTLCYNFKRAADTDAWAKLTLEQLVSILQREDVIVSTEYDVYEGVQKWVIGKCNENDSSNTAGDVLSLIEFRNMNRDELDKVTNSQLYTETLSKLPKIESNIEGAIRLRALEGTFTPAFSARRCYLSTPGSVFYQQLNTAARSASYSSNTVNIKLEVSEQQPLSTYYWHLKCFKKNDEKIFKIALPIEKPREPKVIRMHQATEIRRVDAVIIVVGSSGIIQHFLLQASTPALKMPLRDRDVLIEFDPIPCANCQQPAVAKIYYKINCECDSVIRD